MNNITIIIMTGSKDRFPYLLMVLNSLVSNFNNCDIHLLFHYNIDYELTKRETSQLNNLIMLSNIMNGKIRMFDYSLYFNESVGKVKWGHVFNNKNNIREWVINFDDDVSIPYTTMKRIIEVLKDSPKSVDYYSLGHVDVNNAHKHIDWDLVVRSRKNLLDFTVSKGMNKLAHHIWIGDDIVDTNIGCGFFAVRKDIFLREDIKEMINSIKKGERGYDVLFASLIKNKKFIFGSTSWHLGLENPFINNKWTNVSPKIKTVIDK